MEPPTISAGRLIASLNAWVPRALKTGLGGPGQRGGGGTKEMSIVDIGRARASVALSQPQHALPRTPSI